jgi:ABC-type multidrug transport system fused ATPase/permease subunit
MPTQKKPIEISNLSAMPWIKVILNILPEIKGMVYKAALMVVLIEFTKLAPPFCLKLALDFLIQGNNNITYACYAVAGVLLASLATTIIEDKYTSIMCNNVFTTEIEVLKRSHTKMLDLDLEYHENHPSGDNVHLLTKGASRLADLSWFMYDQFLGAIFQIILTVIILIVCDYRVGLLFTLFLPITLYLIHKNGKALQPDRKRYHSKFREATWEMNQSLINVKTVKDYCQEKQEHEKYSRLLGQYQRLAFYRIRKEAKLIVFRDIFLTTARLSVLTSSIYYVYLGSMSAGSFFLFATLSEKVIASIYRLGRLHSFLGDSIESINQFADLFQQKRTVLNPENGLSAERIEGKIEFKNTNFAYRETEVLKSINVKIPARSVVALVGRSGAGKSTFIKLLMRHYDVNSGELLIDNQNIKEYDLNSLRSKIAVVAQDIEVFDTSIAKNIAYGLDAPLEKIKAAAKIANADQFIENFPDGYETRIGERGLKLSGGQKQRLGIARALLRNPAILIFDEATSSLDSESERLIQDSLINIAKQQTIIIIAHRLSTIEHADQIIVLDDGQIVEQGNHRELMEQKGLFAMMRDLQDLGELRK